jgi:hypothetical protein
VDADSDDELEQLSKVYNEGGGVHRQRTFTAPR